MTWYNGSGVFYTSLSFKLRYYKKSPIVAVNGKINPIMINIIELVSFEKKSKLNKTKLMMIVDN